MLGLNKTNLLIPTNPISIFYLYLPQLTTTATSGNTNFHFLTSLVNEELGRLSWPTLCSVPAGCSDLVVVGYMEGCPPIFIMS